MTKKKKSKKSVVWIWRAWDDNYYVGRTRPRLDSDGEYGNDDSDDSEFCWHTFEKRFPFFTMPPNSLGKITNTANTLTFEIIETKVK